MQKIIEKIIAARKQKGLTQKQLAEMTGMKQPNLSDLERGKFVPKIKTLLRIAKALDMELDIEFLEREGNDD